MLKVKYSDFYAEPAQQAARSHQLFLELIDLVARDSYDSRSRLGFICPLLNYSLQDSENPPLDLGDIKITPLTISR